MGERGHGRGFRGRARGNYAGDVKRTDGGGKGNMGTVDQLCGGSEADVELLEFFDIVADG